ncbi:MAG: hypothetical protein ABJD11_13350 [Gemmatimonadota bacterium]
MRSAMGFDVVFLLVWSGLTLAAFNERRLLRHAVGVGLVVALVTLALGVLILRVLLTMR